MNCTTLHLLQGAPMQEPKYPELVSKDPMEDVDDNDDDDNARNDPNATSKPALLKSEPSDRASQNSVLMSSKSPSSTFITARRKRALLIRTSDVVSKEKRPDRPLTFSHPHSAVSLPVLTHVALPQKAKVELSHVTAWDLNVDQLITTLNTSSIDDGASSADASAVPVLGVMIEP